MFVSMNSRIESGILASCSSAFSNERLNDPMRCMHRQPTRTAIKLLKCSRARTLRSRIQAASIPAGPAASSQPSSESKIITMLLNSSNVPTWCVSALVKLPIIACLIFVSRSCVHASFLSSFLIMPTPPGLTSPSPAPSSTTLTPASSNSTWSYSSWPSPGLPSPSGLRPPGASRSSVCSRFPHGSGGRS